ncbi:cytidine deaminase [Podospora conica]|nr:cytidine deaminase [Schizothecium conicum]
MPPPNPPTLSLTSPTDTSQTCTTHSLSPTTFTALVAAATAAKSRSYSPYSSFRVGCALLLSDSDSNEIVTGANVENASYPVTTCAERVALQTAVVAGHRGFRAVAVATDAATPASPCGMCRQGLREFVGLDVPVVMVDGVGGYVVLTLGELLPLSFGPEALGVTAEMGK